ncbi:head completion/stabilization protein, partial [Salmonella enterica subsp. enterica serovar Virginia]|nr:head completion/stabilization protein [Salmonella enterica subsp. enterica serovar Virginia]
MRRFFYAWGRQRRTQAKSGDEPVIKNTFFFPDIDPKRVRERMRLEQTVAPARLREAIKSG